MASSLLQVPLLRQEVLEICTAVFGTVSVGFGSTILGASATNPAGSYRLETSTPSGGGFRNPASAWIQQRGLSRPQCSTLTAQHAPSLGGDVLVERQMFSWLTGIDVQGGCEAVADIRNDVRSTCKSLSGVELLIAKLTDVASGVLPILKSVASIASTLVWLIPVGILSYLLMTNASEVISSIPKFIAFGAFISFSFPEVGSQLLSFFSGLSAHRSEVIIQQSPVDVLVDRQGFVLGGESAERISRLFGNWLGPNLTALVGVSIVSATFLSGVAAFLRNACSTSNCISALAGKLVSYLPEALRLAVVEYYGSSNPMADKSPLKIAYMTATSLCDDMDLQIEAKKCSGISDLHSAKQALTSAARRHEKTSFETLLVDRLVKRLTQTAKDAAPYADSTRVCPPVIVMSGDSQAGKSTLANLLMHLLGDGAWTFPWDAKHHDNWADQDVTLFDEVTGKRVPKFYDSILQFASPTVVKMNMADLAGKQSATFTSKYILATTNIASVAAMHANDGAGRSRHDAISQRLTGVLGAWLTFVVKPAFKLPGGMTDVQKVQAQSPEDLRNYAHVDIYVTHNFVSDPNPVKIEEIVNICKNMYQRAVNDRLAHIAALRSFREKYEAKGLELAELVVDRQMFNTRSKSSLSSSSVSSSKGALPFRVPPPPVYDVKHRLIIDPDAPQYSRAEVQEIPVPLTWGAVVAREAVRVAKAIVTSIFGSWTGVALAAAAVVGFASFFGPSKTEPANVTAVRQAVVPVADQPCVKVHNNTVTMKIGDSWSRGLIVESRYNPTNSRFIHFILVNFHLFLSGQDSKGRPEYHQDGTPISITIPGCSVPFTDLFDLTQLSLLKSVDDDGTEDVVLYAFTPKANALNPRTSLVRCFLPASASAASLVQSASILRPGGLNDVRREPLINPSLRTHVFYTTDDSGVRLMTGPSIAYENECKNGDCGSPIVSSQGHILGIHASKCKRTALHNSTYMGLVVTRDVILEGIQMLFPESSVVSPPHLLREHSNFVQPLEPVSEMPRHAPSGPNGTPFVFSGVVRCTQNFNRCKNSNVPSGLSNMYTDACTKQLAVVDWLEAKEILGPEIDGPRSFIQYNLGMKFGPTPPITPADVREYSYQANRVDYRPAFEYKTLVTGLWELDVCLNGTEISSPVDERTGSGFPFNKMPGVTSGKHHLISKVNGRFVVTQPLVTTFFNLEDKQLMGGTMPTWFRITTPKPDEVVSDAKRESAQPRLISMHPFTNALLCRRYFGSFCEAIMATRLLTPSALGIRPAIEWDVMIRSLMEVGDAFGSDAVKWDTNVTFESLANHFLSIANEWYKLRDSGWRVEHDRARGLLVLDVTCGREIFSGMVWEAVRGMSSGSQLTAIGNTTDRSASNAAAFFHVLKNSPGVDKIKAHSQLFRTSNTKVFAGGDDLFQATHKTLQPIWNFKSCQRGMIATRGINTTPAVKGDTDAPYTSPLDVDFYCCTSAWNTELKRYLPVLAISSLGKALKYVTTKLPLVDAISQNAMGVLLYSAPHGRAFFEKGHRQLSGDGRLQPRSLITYDDAILLWNRGESILQFDPSRGVIIT